MLTETLLVEFFGEATFPHGQYRSKTILSFFERYYHPENDNIVFWTILSSWMKISAERYYRYYHFQCNFIVFFGRYYRSGR